MPHSRFPGSLSEAVNAYADVLAPYWPYAAGASALLGVFGAYKLLWRCIPGPHNHAKLGFNGRTVLITGASTGLGRALAVEFYKRGAKVILTARSIDKLQQVCLELETMGAEKKWSNPHTPEYRYLDLAELNGDEGSGQITDLRELAIDGKTIDVLVNCAGLSNRGSCRETPLAVQRKVMDVNFFGHVAVTRALLDSIPDDGAIVTIGSLQGRFALPYRSAYSASKHAVQAFFDSLRGEERPQLQVLTVSAGYINTGFGSRALTAEGKPIGVEDQNQLKGMFPEYAARRIVDALAARKTELVLAKFVHRFAIFMRVFTPDLLWWVLHRRATKELEAQRQKQA